MDETDRIMIEIAILLGMRPIPQYYLDSTRQIWLESRGIFITNEVMEEEVNWFKEGF